MSVPLLAQFKGDGYYRIQNNSERKRYLSIANNKIDAANKSSLESGKAGNVFALKMIDNPVSDPSTIIYVIKEKDGYTLEAQGMNTLKLTGGLTLKVYSDKNGKGDWLYGTKAGNSRYLLDSDLTDGYIRVVGSAERNLPQAYWTFKPIDQTNEYFGITPEITIGDKYYTTLYASFPFELSDGMKAYYVSNDNTADRGDAAEIKEIGKKIPAATPVIIECSSQDPANNIVTLLAPDQNPSGIKGNKLQGIYFSFVKYKKAPEENTNSEFVKIKNVKEYDAATMRVLGVNNGKLSLVKASDDQLIVTNIGKYLPANKTYYIVSASAPESLTLYDSTGYQEQIAGINNIINDEQPSTKRGIYTLTGIKVREDNTTDNLLQKGIYIINGKKTIIR